MPVTWGRERGMAIIVGVARESAVEERGVALTPETCKKLVAAGAQVRVERGAGRGASFRDDAYAAAGALLVDSAGAALEEADVVLCVQPPEAAQIARMREGAALGGSLAPPAEAARAEAIAARKVLSFPLERLPRTTRAQAMDVLSSQAGMAGYKAVLIGAQLAP